MIKQILHVEDDPDHVEIVHRSFKEHGLNCELFHVSDGEQALDYLYKQRKFKNDKRHYPDLILLDLRLPKRDGLEVLHTIKNDEKLKSIPVIIFTSSNNIRDLKNAYQNEVNSYLVKPLDFDQFLDLVKVLGLYWINCNQNPILNRH